MRRPGQRTGRVVSGASSLCVNERLRRMVCDRRRDRARVCLPNGVCDWECVTGS